LNTYDALEKNGILHEWNYEKNNELGHTPYNISLHSHKKIWWKCALNHEWQDTLDHRLLRGDSCPYCSGHRVLVGFNDLSTTCPNLIKEWDFEKNNALGFFPEKLSAGSRTKVWWKCSICKNSWQSTIKDRLRGRGCAVCSSRVIISGYNDFASNYPYLLKEWDYAKNNADIDPNNMAKNSNKSVWWKCQFCGNSWKAIVNDRTRGKGCPKCAKRSKTSFPEQAIFYYLKKVFPEAINGYKNNLPQNMELDIFIPSINTAIEYDGPWHKVRDQEDERKYDWCKSQNIILLRISEIERENSNNCCDAFLVSPFLKKANKSFPQFMEHLLKLLRVEETGLNNIDIEKDRPKILEQFVAHVNNNSLAEKYPELALEWNYDKNESLTPSMFSYGSNQKVWWKCKVCGHEWCALINNRVNNHGCPICANVKRGKRKNS
jgi:rubrerythrin